MRYYFESKSEIINRESRFNLVRNLELVFFGMDMYELYK